MTSLAFTVPLPPRSWQRTNLIGRRLVSSREQRDYQHAVGVHAVAAVQAAKRAGVPWAIDAEAFDVALVFWLPTQRKPDVDNLAKNVMDACNGILWDDDRRVASILATRSVDVHRPRTVILVNATTLARVKEDADVYEEDALARAVKVRR